MFKSETILISLKFRYKCLGLLLWAEESHNVTYVYKYLMGEAKKRQSGSCQWCPVTELAMGMICNPGTWGMWLKHLKITFCCEGGWTLKQKRFWVSISRDFQNPSGHNPEKSALAGPWAGSWTSSPLEVRSKLIYSVVL